jgi:hypothetical protein
MKLEYNSITTKSSHSLRLGQNHVKRDDFSFLEGRVFGATGQPFSGRLSKRLAGSQSEAQPPGARMAVREKTVTRCAPRVKPYATTCGCFASATRSPRTFTPLDGGNYFTVLDDLPPQPARAPKRRGEVGPIDADLREFLSAGSENRQFVSQIGMRAYGRTPPAWQFVIQFASLRLV